MEISPHVHLVPGVVANPYLLIDDGEITLIDTGLPWSRNRILGYIRGLGFSPRSIRRIIITHTDLDHVGGLPAIRNASGALVLASEVESQALAEGHPSRAIQPRNRVMSLLMKLMTSLGKPARVRVDETLSDGQVLPILGGLQVLETSGHTPGHISLYLASASILFTGDSIISEGDNLYASRDALTWNRQKADESVRRQAALGPQIVCPGHGPVIRDAVEKFPAL